MLTCQVRTETKSLAQVLYEASPSVGWSGPWRNLQPDQTAWWEAYADLARRHLHEEASTATNTPTPDDRM